MDLIVALLVFAIIIVIVVYVIDLLPLPPPDRRDRQAGGGPDRADLFARDGTADAGAWPYRARTCLLAPAAAEA